MAHGSISRVLDGAGDRRRRWWIPDGAPIPIGDVGFIRTAAGTGNRIIPGVGRRFIMADGIIIRGPVGFGFLIPSGRQLG